MTSVRPRSDVVVIDYGMGNLRSIANALREVGAEVSVSAEPAAVQGAERLVLPGVGAFGRSMFELEERGLIDPIRQAIAGGRPFLGICLGFQVLFEASTEHGEHPGLGLVPGRVERFEGNGLIVPHMGWNQINHSGAHPLLAGVEDGAHVYFVHSFRPRSAGAAALATTDYGGRFVSAVARDNLVGCQFHPEKSGALGLRILRNFVGWSP